MFDSWLWLVLGTCWTGAGVEASTGVSGVEVPWTIFRSIWSCSSWTPTRNRFYSAKGETNSIKNIYLILLWLLCYFSVVSIYVPLLKPISAWRCTRFIAGFHHFETLHGIPELLPSKKRDVLRQHGPIWTSSSFIQFSIFSIFSNTFPTLFLSMFLPLNCRVLTSRNVACLPCLTGEHRAQFLVQTLADTTFQGTVGRFQTGLPMNANANGKRWETR